MKPSKVKKILNVSIIVYNHDFSKMKKTVGYGIEEVPEKVSDNDKKCPYHGEISVRGKLFEGIVVSDSMQRTVIVSWDNLIRSQKYNRYYKKRSKVAAHNPDAIKAKVGDTVLIGETKPLSKTKHFVVLKVVKKAEVLE